MGRVLTIVLAIVILGILVYAFYRMPASSNALQPTPPITSLVPTTSPPAATGTPETAPTITYDGTVFTPSSIIVTAGTTVTMVNNSVNNMQLQSNPHPQHTDDPDLNVGVIPPGGSQTFVVTKKGTFGYHDHLNPTATGTITIQ